MINGSIQEENITIVNMYAPNIGTTHKANAAAIKGETDSNTVIVEDFPLNHNL